MLFGDAKKMLDEVLVALKQEIEANFRSAAASAGRRRRAPALR